MIEDANLQPGIDEVLQAEAPEPAVKVTVTDPVRTQDVPRKGGSTFTKNVGTSVGAAPLLRADHRRGSAIVIADATVWISYAPYAPQDTSVMARVPAGVPIRSTAVVPIWVKADTGTANVSFIVEDWATGE